MTTHHGSCHCGAVKYQVELELAGKATRCNCSICMKLGTTGATVKPDAFRLLSGEEALSSYARRPMSSRFFCKHCGVHCFSRGDIPELGGPFVGIVVNTLDDLDVGALAIAYWDGRHDNWMAGTRPTPWPVA
jgi:hypothetical protein